MGCNTAAAQRAVWRNMSGFKSSSLFSPWFRHGSTLGPKAWETSNRIFSYAEAYDWYTDYGRTGNVEAANHSYELYDEGSPAPDSFQESI